MRPVIGMVLAFLGLVLLVIGIALMAAGPADARCRAHHCTWHGMRHAGWHLRTPLRRLGYRWHREREVVRRPRERWFAVVSIPAAPRVPAPPPPPAEWKPDPAGWPDGWLERADSPARWRPEL